MGATITTEQAAAVFRAAGSGYPTWCLFERLYDRNTYPHTPEWTCIQIGRLDAALERVFCAAADCEGGMIQTPRGELRPETYIDRWMNAMRNPIAMPDVQVHLTKPEPTYSQWLDDERSRQWADVRERYLAIGPSAAAAVRNDLEVIDRLEAGKTVPVLLHGHPELVSVVLDGRSWRAIDDAMIRMIVMEPARAELGYRPVAARTSSVNAPQPQMLRVDAHTRIERVDGVWKEVGWPYSIVGAYVRGLWKQELETPGLYKRLIGEYRKAVEAAPSVPAGTTVVVPLASRDARDREELINLAEKVGGTVDGTEVRIPWVATDSLAPVHFLLSGKDATWEVPESAEQVLHGRQEALALSEPPAPPVRRFTPRRGGDGMER